MKISIAIPTRSRAIYLKNCLESVLIAADAASCPVEIVVLDNASTDNTAEVVKEFTSDRIVYFRQSKRVSMRQNFEDALSQTSGTHVIFIGDDDGILPNGIRILQEIIAQYQPEIIKWRTLNFIWPNDQTQVPGHLELRPRKLSGRIRQMNPSKIRDNFLNGKQRNYRDGGMIYHGCISRKLIDRVCDLSDGTYFWCSSPDVYTSVANILAAQMDIFNIDRPISLGGASPRSNGVSAKNMAQTGNTTDAKEVMSFISEAENDLFRSTVSDQCMSIELHLLGALELACKLQNIPFRINKKNWIARVNKEISTFSPAMAAACNDDLKKMLDTEIEVTDAPKPIDANTIDAAEYDMRKMADEPLILKHKLSKTTISGGAQMADIVQASRFLDDLVNNSDLQEALHSSKPFTEIFRLRTKLRHLD